MYGCVPIFYCKIELDTNYYDAGEGIGLDNYVNVPGLLGHYADTFVSSFASSSAALALTIEDRLLTFCRGRVLQYYIFFPNKFSWNVVNER